MATNVNRGPKPPGNGWIPIPGGWLNTATGAMVQSSAGGGRTQSSPGAPTVTAPPVRTHSPVSAAGVNADAARWTALAAAIKAHQAKASAHPVPSPAPTAGSSFPTGGNGARGPAGGGTTQTTKPTTKAGLGSILGMIAGLLGTSGTSNLLSTGLAADAAAPDNALAATLQSEIDQLPDAKAQALANITGWYGKVKSDAQTAADRSANLAGSGADALADAAKGIAASLGGSANAASGQIGAVGANDANELKAIGASDSQLAKDLAPIFDAQAADASTQTQKQFSTGLTDLENQLGQATGQAAADKAAALMQIVTANNNARQSNFANKSDLLKTLASLQISGMNAVTQSQSAAILNALHKAEATKAQTEAAGGYGALTPAQRQALANNITKGLLDPNTNKLSTDWPTALRNARNSVREAGLDPMDPQVIQTIIGPALANAGITGQGGGFWQPIFQP